MNLNTYLYIYITLNKGVLTYMQQTALRLAYLSYEVVAPQLVHTRSHTPNTKMWKSNSEFHFCPSQNEVALR